MRTTSSKTIPRARQISIALLLLLPYSGNAAWIDYCPGNAPPAYIVGTTVNGATNIVLVATNGSPIDSNVDVSFRIESSRVPVTFHNQQPGYYDRCRKCDYTTCWYENVWIAGYEFNTSGSLYPRGTATIRLDGVDVGTVSISGGTTTYTAPPVRRVGSVNYVAQFTPAPDSGFTPATSNVVALISQLNPGVLMSIFGVILLDD